jgi:hypothetical protein
MDAQSGLDEPNTEWRGGPEAGAEKDTETSAKTSTETSAQTGTANDWEGAIEMLMVDAREAGNWMEVQALTAESVASAESLT